MYSRVKNERETEYGLREYMNNIACGLNPHKFYKPTLGPKYARNRPYN